LIKHPSDADSPGTAAPAPAARGLSNAEIATKLIIGEATVKTHVARIIAKLDVRDRIQAIVLAYESGLL
jgi:DNA-binding NarL/FixJ family response regulator